MVQAPHRCETSMIRRLPLLALPLLLAACATTPQNTPPETLYDARLDTAQGQALTLEQAVARVADADIVLVG